MNGLYMRRSYLLSLSWIRKCAIGGLVALCGTCGAGLLTPNALAELKTLTTLPALKSGSSRSSALATCCCCCWSSAAGCGAPAAGGRVATASGAAQRCSHGCASPPNEAAHPPAAGINAHAQTQPRGDLMVCVGIRGAGSRCEADLAASHEFPPGGS